MQEIMQKQMIPIKQFTIAYRAGISLLDIEGLSRINVLTGSNSCGKTTVLDAIFDGRQVQCIPCAYFCEGYIHNCSKGNMNQTKNKALLKAVQKFDPNITGFTKIEGHYFFSIEGVNHSVPIVDMGIGFRRFFFVSLAIIEDSYSYIIIDELELHLGGSCFNALLEVILTSALKGKTQFFVSVHNAEFLLYIVAMLKESRFVELQNHFVEFVIVKALINGHIEHSVYRNTFKDVEKQIVSDTAT